MDAPALINLIPAQFINEQAAYGPFDLKEFISGDNLRFSAELKSGGSLPQGLICTTDGVLTGIPARGTQGAYEIVVAVEGEGGSISVDIPFTIQPTLLTDKDTNYFNQLKMQVWEALEKRLPVPDLGSLLERDITIQEIYYLLERYSILKIWDVFNLEPPGALIPLSLPGVSEHYHVYDRGSCLVACPKDLFSHDRTIADGIKTARVLAREAYQRNWTIELVGTEKLTRAAWVELQMLGEQHGKWLEIVNYSASSSDMKVYLNESTSLKMKGPE